MQIEDYKGGAGSSGQNHSLEPTPNDGYGGDGLAVDITCVNVIYAGGGNGSAWNFTVSPVRDPNKLIIESRGGGGFGSDNGNAEDGKNGTGGGGGGQANYLAQFSAGAGGSGIVIIRYKYTNTIVPTIQSTGFLNYTNANGWSLSQVSTGTTTVITNTTSSPFTNIISSSGTGMFLVVVNAGTQSNNPT